MTRGWFGNIALSLDNKLGIEDNKTTISNISDFQIVHQFRNKLSGIVVGSNTILVDNPSLLTKEKFISRGEVSHPVPIIFDRRGRISLNHRVFSSKRRKCIWVTNKTITVPDNIYLIKFTSLVEIKIKINNLLNSIYRKGDVMIEGGAILMKEFLRAGVIDKLRIFTSNLTIPNSSLELIFPGANLYKLLSTDMINGGIERIYRIYPKN